MTPLETLRGMLDGSIAAESERWPAWIPHRPMWPAWIPHRPMDVLSIAIEYSLIYRNDAWCEAALTVLDDPLTEPVHLLHLRAFHASRLSMRLLKHPKVIICFRFWDNFEHYFQSSKNYTDAIVLLPAERVILPTFSVRRRLGPLIVNVLAHLVQWTIPADYSSRGLINELICAARNQPGEGLDELVSSHPCLFGRQMVFTKYLPDHLVRFVVTVNTRPDLGVGDFGPR